MTRGRAAISRSPLRRMRLKAGTLKTQEPMCEEMEDRVWCNRIATARCVNCTKHLCPGHTYRLHRHVVVYHQARVVAERAQQQESCRPCLKNNNLLHLQPHPAHGFNGIGFNMRNKDEIVEILNPQTLVDVGNIGHLDNEIDMAGLEKTECIKVENIKPQVDRFVFPRRTWRHRPCIRSPTQLGMRHRTAVVRHVLLFYE